jgi:hypothetical protein
MNLICGPTGARHVSWDCLHSTRITRVHRFRNSASIMGERIDYRRSRWQTPGPAKSLRRSRRSESRCGSSYTAEMPPSQNLRPPAWARQTCLSARVWTMLRLPDMLIRPHRRGLPPRPGERAVHRDLLCVLALTDLAAEPRKRPPT